MTAPALFALSPILVLVAATVVLLMQIAFLRNYSLTVVLACAGLAGSLLALAASGTDTPVQSTGLLQVDRFAVFFQALILLATLAVSVFAYGYLRDRSGRREEFYLLLLLAAIGTSVIAASVHLVSFFLGLEILSVALYGLIAYLRTEAAGVEAGIKYLILAAVSSAFFLFGAALLYADSGSMAFAGILASPGFQSGSILSLAGFGLAAVGIGFKLGVVPFHLWVPDIYQGAPAPAAALLATISKGAVLAFLLRLSAFLAPGAGGPVFAVVAGIAVLSMLAGNVLALRQANVKRLLGYSSVAHFGYILLAFLAAGGRSLSAAGFYLAAYCAAMLAAFGVAGAVSRPGHEAEDTEDFRGLAWRNPFAAGVLTLSLFSLIGLPFTAGFIAKINLLAAGVDAALWFPSAALVAGSAIGLYYYLRLVLVLFHTEDDGEKPAAGKLPLGAPTAIILALLVAVLIWLGTYPAPLLDFLGRIAGGGSPF